MTQEWTLRRAEQHDIGALDHLFQRSYARLLAPDYAPSVLVTAVPVIGRAQPALVTSGLFFVIEQAGDLIGAGGWSLAAPGGQPGQRGVGHIRHVATDPDHVRKGIGKALLAHILLGAKASGMAQMRCQSTLSAVPFYQSMGFNVLGDIVVPLRGGLEFPAVMMSAQL